MIGIVVPAHDEQSLIDACISSLVRASACPQLRGEEVLIVVVLDACRDRTGNIARSLGAKTIDVEARNVGIARSMGAHAALHAGARWLAFTDADSTVAPDWLTAQLALQSDAVCGTVAVNDWGIYGERMQRHYEASYTDRDGHAHIHGANMGVSAQAYLRAGGFMALSSKEDVALVEALQASGATIAWSAAPRVVTSARQNFKAQGGFGARLAQIELEKTWAGQTVAVTQGVANQANFENPEVLESADASAVALGLFAPPVKADRLSAA